MVLSVRLFWSRNGVMDFVLGLALPLTLGQGCNCYYSFGGAVY
jgi:hypothetical protein